MKRLLSPCIFITFLAVIPVLPALANMEYDGDISIGNNDNIPNAVSQRDIFSDSFVAGNFNVGKLWVPSPGKTVLLSGHFGLEKFGDSAGLDRASYGGSINYVQRLGLGAYTPRISVGLSADYRNFDTDMRDGWFYRASVGVQKRFTPEMHGSLSLAHERRTADKNKATAYNPAVASADVFNQTNNVFTASLDYTLANNSMLTTQYSYRDGEVDASTNPGSAFFPFARAIANDPQLCDSCSNYVVYLVGASVHSLVLDWNLPLGRDTSASLNLERRIANTDGSNTYTTNIIRLRLNRRF